VNVEAELLSLVTAYKGSLPAGVVEHIEELARAGECTVALEELCSYLAETPAHHPSGLLSRIVSLGSVLKVDPSYWQPLTEAPPASGPT
jgi:hypothetical protein